ncbi:MAG TPA: SPOR domain-containing protein [Steroidobacteraceae bacterium]|jgi:outer membrane protein assembly factor BamD (BamD/ComL family)|nr:SPOR domain-containing protein [Steroidobacteraceae bacterium]
MKILIHSLCLLTAATLLACSSPEADWNQATSQGTAAAYQAFLAKYPNDSHAAEARQRMQTIQDGQDWITAQTGNTVASYQQYLAAEPNGANVQAARAQLMGLQRAAAWPDAKNAGTASALQAFLQKYPQGPEADQARAQLAQFDYQVQLGTYGGSQQADRARAQLQDRYGKDLQAVVVIPPSGKSKAYHVSSANMTEDQAKAACATLKKSHQHCEVTKLAGGAQQS